MKFNYQNKSKEQLIAELEKLQKAHNSLKTTIEADITERKIAEEKLRQSEERFQLLFNKAPLGYQSLDINGNFIEINQQWLDTLGYQRDEVIGKWFGDFLTPAFQDSFRKRFPIFKAQGKIHSKFEMVHKNGSVLFIAFDGRIGNDSQGNFKQTHCILQDITERKQAEEKLRASEENLSITLHSIGDGVIATDKNGLIVQMNPVAEKLCGWLMAEAKGKHLNEIFKIINAETREIVANPVDKVLEKGETVGLANHTVLISKDGTEYQIADSAAPIKNKEGEISGVVLVFSDATEKYVTELALKESEKKFRNFFENSVVGKSITSIDGNISVNKAFCKIVGYSEEELNKINWKEITHKDDIGLNVNIVNSILKGEKQSERWEKRYIHKDGHIVWVDISTALQRDDTGNPLYFITAANDITERKQAEEALRKSQEMIVSSQSVAHIGSYSTKLNADDLDKSAWVCSPELHTIFGIDETYPHTIAGWAGFIHPDHREELVAYHESVVKEKKSFNHEYKIIRINDGAERWVHGTGEIEYDKHGNPIRMYGAIQDITERKQAEEKLRASEENLSITLHSIGDGVIATDKNGLIVQMNPVAEKLCGWLMAEAKGKHLNEVFRIINAVTRQTVTNPVDKVLKKGETVGLANHTVLISKDGTEYQIADSAAPIKNKEGKISGVVLVFSDITEKYAVEKLINESENYLKETQIIAQLGTYALDVDTGSWTSSEILDEIFGIEKNYNKSVQGWVSIIHPDWQKIMNDYFVNEVIGEKIKFDKEYQIIRISDKKMRWVHGLGKLEFDEQLNPVRMLGTIQDITERKQAEEKIKQDEEYLELFFSQSLDGFFFMMLDEAIAWNESVDKEKALDYVFENQHITKANQAILDQYGATEKEFLGLTPNPLFSHDIKHGRAVWKEFFDKGSLHYDTHEKKFDGTDMIVEGDYICLYDLQNRITGHFGIQRDVTEQRQSNKKLQQASEHWSKTFSAIQDGIAILDIEQNVLLQNEAFQKIVERISTHHCGKHCFHLIHGTECPIENCPFVRTKISKKRELMELVIDGLVFEVVVDPIFNENQELVGAVHIMTDITERKKANEELLKLSRAVEQSPVSVVITNKNGDIQYVNEKFCNISGYSKEETMGKNPNILRSDYHDKKNYEELWETILAGKEWFGVFHNVKKNGEMYWESASISPVINNGEITHFVAVKEDITAKKVFEETQKIILEIAQLAAQNINLYDFLAEAHQKLNNILRAENFYVAFYNRSNNTYSFPYYIDQVDDFMLNKPYDLHGGYTDLVRKTGKGKLILSDNNKNEIDGISNHYGKTPSVWLGVPLKLSVEEEAFGVIAIQDYHHLEAYSEIELHTLEIIANNIAGFIERINHIEALKKAKDQAQESDRLKSAFLANMSHEIRTPMNGILGFASILKTPDLTGAQQQEYISIIERSGSRMLNIINDIVDISKIEAGLMKVDLQESNINEQIEYIYTFFKPEVEAKGMKLFFKNALPNKAAVITTDREKLFAILTNLVKNAIKYSEQGSIELGYERVVETRHAETRHVETRHAFSLLQFYVKDTGIGIPKDRQEAIFERFIQADIEDKKVRQGAGLGLAITKSYIEMLGGKIWVESDESMGSTFYFTLPYQNKSIDKLQHHEDSLTNLSETHIKNLKILIADDDENSQLLISIIMKSFAKEVLIANTGVEVVDICRNNPDIDLVLMDIQMPNLNGYEATKQIRKFNKNLIIIAQTAFALTGDREKAMAAGCTNYISKPIKKAELIGLVKEYFSKEEL